MAARRSDHLAWRMAGVLLLVSAAIPAAAQTTAPDDRPLPDPAPFLEAVKARLKTDDQLQQQYRYVETQIQRKVNGLGRMTGETTRVYEVYPGLPGEGRYRRLRSEDGIDVAAAKLEEKDRARQKKVMEYVRKRERETPAEKQRHLLELERSREQEAREVDDIFLVFAIQMVGRDVVDGVSLIRFTLTPRPGAKPLTDDGKFFARFKGHAWVSEDDYELARLELEAINDISLALGLLARVHKGTTLSFSRRKVNGEVWLPAEARVVASGRLLLVKRMRMQVIQQFSDYRKAQVDTSTIFSVPR
jgi:hypothetical protein